MSYNKQMECVAHALLSVAATPRETYPPRLALAACENASDLSERDLWKAMQDDPELLHRVNAIHFWMCSINLGELTEVIRQGLAAQEKGARHA
jgi:hypothetical protein